MYNNTLLQQQNKDLSEQLKSKDDDDNDENILQALYEEIKTEKNKSEAEAKEKELTVKNKEINAAKAEIEQSLETICLLLCYKSYF